MSSSNNNNSSNNNTLPGINNLLGAVPRSLPSYLEAQPKLVRSVCVRCVKRLVKEDDPIPHRICSTVIEGNINCPVCKSAKSTCVTIPPRLRRATNFLIGYLCTHYAEQGGLTAPAAGRRVAGIKAYAKQWAAVYDGLAAAEEKLAVASGGSAGLEAVLVRREAEFNRNMERFEKGYGGVGEMQDTNVHVNRDMEEAWLNNPLTTGKNAIWYGI